MLFPSNAVIVLSLGIAAILMVVNWVLWGLNDPRDLRLPRSMTPLSGREFQELVMPGKLTAENSREHGFKHVA
jgi:hypothetical protein